jgi:hypothetical protein
MAIRRQLFQEQMFGADEQVRGKGLSDQEAAPPLGVVLNHRWPSS